MGTAGYMISRSLLFLPWLSTYTASVWKTSKNSPRGSSMQRNASTALYVKKPRSVFSGWTSAGIDNHLSRTWSLKFVWKKENTRLSEGKINSASLISAYKLEDGLRECYRSRSRRGIRRKGDLRLELGAFGRGRVASLHEFAYAVFLYELSHRLLSEKSSVTRNNVKIQLCKQISSQGI